MELKANPGNRLTTVPHLIIPSLYNKQGGNSRGKMIPLWKLGLLFYGKIATELKANNGSMLATVPVANCFYLLHRTICIF